MSYRRDELIEQCQAKVWYETREDAIAAINEKNVRFGNALWPYKCIICRLFHLTGQKPDKERSAALRQKEEWYLARVTKSSRKG